MLEGRESQVLSYSHSSYIFNMRDRVTIQCVPVLINASDVSFGEVLQCSIRIAAPILVVELAYSIRYVRVLPRGELYGSRALHRDPGAPIACHPCAR